MLAGKCTCSYGVETMTFQDVSELYQGIVKSPVSEGHYRNSQCTISFYCIQILEHKIRKPACIGGHSEDHQLIRRNIRKAFSHLRKSEIVFFRFCSKIGRDFITKCGNNFFCSSGRAEVYLPYFFYFHNSILSLPYIGRQPFLNVICENSYENTADKTGEKKHCKI